MREPSSSAISPLLLRALDLLIKEELLKTAYFGIQVRLQDTLLTPSRQDQTRPGIFKYLRTSLLIKCAERQLLGRKTKGAVMENSQSPPKTCVFPSSSLFSLQTLVHKSFRFQDCPESNFSFER